MIKSLEGLRQLKKINARRLFHGVFAKEDRARFEVSCISALKSELGDAFNAFELRFEPEFIAYKRQFWRYPEMSREVMGVLIFRSNDYLFECDGKSLIGSILSTKEINFTDTGFYVLDLKNAKIEYVFQDT